MSERHGDVLRWAAERGLAAAVERYEPTRDRVAAHRAGRRAATRALAALGGPPLGDDAHADGRPVWPRGWTGSISHRDGTALAITGRDDHAIGVDLEAGAALPLADARFVLDDDEHAASAAAPDPDHAATVRWSAKEAAFKAWNEAAAGALPGPIDPRRHLHVDVRGDAVRVEARHELASATTPVDGRVWSGDTTIVVVVVLPLSPP